MGKSWLKNFSKIYSKQNVIYGLGNTFTTMRSSLVNTYRTFFMTSVLMIPAATVGVYNSISGTIVTIFACLVGVLIQMSRPKMGRLRFWLIVGGFVSALGLVLAFSNPGLQGSSLVLYTTIGFTIGELGYNIFYTPFIGCVSLLSNDNESRGNMSAVRLQMNTLGKIIFSTINVSLLAVLASAFGSEASGYFVFAIILAILIVVGSMLIQNLIKGKESYDNESQKEQKKNPVSQMIKVMFSRPILLSLIGVMAKGMCITVVSATAVYFYTYVIGDKSGLAWYMSISTFILLAGGFVCPFIVKKIGLMNTVFVGFGIYGTALVVAFLCGANAITATAALCIGMFGQGLYHSVDVGVYANAVDYVRFTTGIDAKGFLYSLYSAIAPLSTAVASLALGFGLDAFGFNPEAITETAQLGIRVVFFLLPTAFFILGAVAYAFMPAKEKKMEELRKQAGQ